MKTLNREELRTAEETLRKHLPKSLKVYGLLFSINRNKPSCLETVVDSWPHFKVIMCRPDPQNELSGHFLRKVAFFSTDEEALRKTLTEENAVDWTTYFLMAGFDVSHAPLLREVSSSREVNSRAFTSVRLLYLADSSHLLTPATDSDVESRMSSLDLSHVDLVNRTWKFGGSEKGRRTVCNLIANFPSCCIRDGRGRPVSWVLLYDYCALGMLHTLPPHRGRGYASLLVAVMARRLRAAGFPVYCFIEEDNSASLRLFTKLGFTEEPSYRAAWFEFNF